MDASAGSPSARSILRQWFFAPPRAHGDRIADRTVSFLELFYDLVYVVLVGQAAAALAHDVGWSSLGRFCALFVVIWFAWLNGSLYHELHGREDGRHRSLIFLQMGLLAVMSVYVAHADGADGRPFALATGLLVAVDSWQWWSVRRYDSPDFAIRTLRYTVVMVAVAIGFLVSALLPAGAPRLICWAVLVVSAYAAFAVLSGSPDASREAAVRVTESMSERFGLLTLIVLGEVVIGVVEGMSETDRGALSITTGLLALTVGYGFWWLYFDGVGRRVPRDGSRHRLTWIGGHLPLQAAIAAAGAGMVSLVQHSGDSHVPTGTAWLLTGSVVVVLASMLAIERQQQRVTGRDRIAVTFPAGILIVLAVGTWAPRPWILALALALVLTVLWFEVFLRAARHPGAA